MYTKKVAVYKTDFEAHVEMDADQEAPSPEDLKVWLDRAFVHELRNVDHPPPPGVRHVDTCIVLGQLRCARKIHKKLQWLNEDTLAAARRGWELRSWDRGTKFFVYRLEDPDDVAREDGNDPYRGPRFTCDEQALEYVTLAAKFGDEVAQKALDLIAATKYEEAQS